MRENGTERTLDQVSVASLAVAERLLRFALQRDVDARGDDEGNVSVAVRQRRRRPLDQPGGLIPRQPAVLILKGKGTLPHARKGLLGALPVFYRHQRVPERVPDNRIHWVAGNDFADAVEAHHTAGGVKDHHKRAHCIQHSGNEVALHRQLRLDTLPGARLAFIGAQPQIQFEPRHHTSGQGAERVAFHLGEHARLRVQHAQCAHGGAVRRDQRRACIESKGPITDADAGFAELLVIGCVRDGEQLRPSDRLVAGRILTAHLSHAQAHARLEPDIVRLHKGDGSGLRVADLRGQASDLVQCRIARSFQHLQLLQGPQPRRLAQRHGQFRPWRLPQGAADGRIHGGGHSVVCSGYGVGTWLRSATSSALASSATFHLPSGMRFQMVM